MVTIYKDRRRGLRAAAVSVILMFLIIALLFQCVSREKDNDSLSAFVSILPLSCLVEQIAGGLVTVHVMVDPGKSPATYDPTPGQMTDLLEADIYFAVGSLPFEQRLLRKIHEANRSLNIVITAKEVEPRIIDQVYDHKHDRDGIHGPVDPHIWLAPPLLKIMADEICKSLVQIDGSHADTYRGNLDRLLSKIDAVHKSIEEALKPYAGRSIFVFHPAFGYFADTYGLKQVSIEVGGKSPSPRQIEDIIQRARAEGVQIIFVQPQFDSRSAKAVAEAIDGVVVPMDPLAKDVLANLKEMADKIKGAFEK